MKQIQWMLRIFQSGWWVFFLLFYFSICHKYLIFKKKKLVILLSAVTISLTSSICNRRHHLQVQTINKWKGLNLGVVRSPTSEGIQAEVRWALNIVEVVCTEGEVWTLRPQRTLLIFRCYYARAIWCQGRCPWYWIPHRLTSEPWKAEHQTKNFLHSCHSKTQVMLQLPEQSGDQSDRKSSSYKSFWYSLF